MDFCGEVYCNFFGELKKRHMDHLIEKILFMLDYDGVLNVRLVSKTWKTAVFECSDKIWRKLVNHGNGHRNLKLLLGKHLEVDFPISVEEEFYYQRFCNTVYFSSKEISRTSLELDFTIDYLPYSFPQYFSTVRHDLHVLGTVWYHFDMNDSYIVAVDPNKPKLKIWSRRFLTSPPKDVNRTVLNIEVHPEGLVKIPGRTFQFSGANCLILASLYYHFESRKEKPGPQTPINTAIFTLRLKANRDFPGSAIDKNQDKPHLKLFDPSPLGLSDYFVRYLTVEGRFLLVVFEDLELDFSMTKFSLVVWSIDELNLSPWKFLEVPMTQGDHFFMDEEYLVVLNRENGLQSTFLVYSMLERETDPARAIASIDVDDTDPRDRRFTKLSDTVQYKSGFLVIGSHRGNIRFIEVKSGRTIRTIQTEINFSAPCSLMRISNSSEFFYLCFAASPPLRGTVFQRWNFNDVIKLGSSLPLASFNAFTGEVLDFKFDELGIVAVMREEGRHGMQILSFLPQCSGCKRISKRIPLKCCSRCKRAKYCSRECQKSNWNHHKTICSKLAVVR